MLEVGAIGIPDEHSSEVVKVIVVKKNAALSEQDVIVHCKDELTGDKRPNVIQFADELPKSDL